MLTQTYPRSPESARSNGAAPLPGEQSRFTSARIEVQVASVLMHAWAEVEHDLVYKPLSGTLSTNEHVILDELNGLVLAGELALQRLEGAIESRIEAAQAGFANQYELASYLLDHVSKALDEEAGQEQMGRADWLHALLVKSGLNSPEKLEPYLDAITPDFEKRSIAEQVIDQVVAEHKERYEALREIQGEAAPDGLRRHVVLGQFMERWLALEHLLGKLGRSVLGTDGRVTSPVFLLRHLHQEGVLDSPTVLRIDPLRRLRNAAVHGETAATTDALENAVKAMNELFSDLARGDHLKVREAATEALGHFQREAGG